MPFKSRAQQAAAFSGGLGAEMKAKALEFAHQTDEGALPERAPSQPNGFPARSKMPAGAKQAPSRAGRRVFRRKPKAVTPGKVTPKLS